MRINQVEELVGIPKKNIRFYESQGLLNPDRDPSNSYREYSLKDVEQLKKIKLLRKLDVPCEEIRKVMTGELSFQECLQDQERKLGKHSHDLALMQGICLQLAEKETSIDTLDASGWLDRMRTLEKGGANFMDAREKDVKQRRIGSIVWASVFILLMLVIMVFILWANTEDRMPIGLLIFLILIPVGVITGIVLALVQRMKELKGGEIYEAGKY